MVATVLIILFYLYAVAFHTSLAAMEIISPLICALSLGYAFHKKNFVWPSRTIMVSLTGLFLTAAVSFVVNIRDYSKLMDYLGEWRWMITFFCFMQFFNLFFNRINFSRFVFVGQITLIIAGFYSFYQFFSGHDFFRKNVYFHFLYGGSPYYRPNSFFGLPTTYAYASAMFLSLSLAFWLREKRSDKKWVIFLQKFYFIISPINIFLTYTRASWAATMITAFTLLNMMNRKLLIRTAIALAVLIPTLYFTFPSFDQRFTSVFDTQYVANHNRFFLWKANWLIFTENPLIGLGFDENRMQIDSYLRRVGAADSVMRNHPHNTYLNYLAGLGIFGFFFFLLFLAHNLKTAIQGIRHSSHSLHKTLFIGTLGIQMILLLGAFTECMFEDLELAHQYIFFTALCEFLTRKYLKPKPL